MPAALAKRRGFESRVLKECIRGGQFSRFYCPKQTQEFILYVTKDTDISKIPNVIAYLAEHQDKLVEKCVEKRKGIRDWYLLFRPRKEHLFRKPKILLRQTGDSIVAAADDEIGFYGIDSVNIAQLKTEHTAILSYLVALLNSSLLNFYYREISQEGGRVLAQVKPQRLKTLPIATGSCGDRSAICKLHNKIASLKALDQNADIHDLLLDLNKRVYHLYGLNRDQIAVVEGRNT